MYCNIVDADCKYSIYGRRSSLCFHTRTRAWTLDSASELMYNYSMNEGEQYLAVHPGEWENSSWKQGDVFLILEHNQDKAEVAGSFEGSNDIIRMPVRIFNKSFEYLLA